MTKREERIIADAVVLRDHLASCDICMWKGVRHCQWAVNVLEAMSVDHASYEDRDAS